MGTIWWRVGSLLLVLGLWMSGMEVLGNGAANAGRIHCETPQFDYGTVTGGVTRVVEHVFVLKNIGGSPLTISRTQACCGSTLALASDSIPPDGAVRLGVRLELGARRGRQRHAIYIHSSDASSPIIQLLVTGMIASPPADATGERP